MPAPEPSPMDIQMAKALAAIKAAHNPVTTPIVGPLGTESNDVYGRRVMTRPNGTATVLDAGVSDPDNHPGYMSQEPDQQGMYYKYQMNRAGIGPQEKDMWKQMYNQWLDQMSQNRSKLVQLLQSGAG